MAKLTNGGEKQKRFFGVELFNLDFVEFCIFAF